MQAISYPRPFAKDATPIHQDLLEAFRNSGYHELRKLAIHSSDDGVRIEGNVRTYYLKQVAQTVAMAVAGVERVDNFLTVE